MGEDLLHGRLVHAGGAPQHPAADVGDAGELEHTLYGAVLAVRTVQDGEDHVHGSRAPPGSFSVVEAGGPETSRSEPSGR